MTPSSHVVPGIWLCPLRCIDGCRIHVGLGLYTHLIAATPALIPESQQRRSHSWSAVRMTVRSDRSPCTSPLA